MPLFSSHRPSSITTSIRAMLNSSPNLDAQTMAQADNLVAQTGQHTALAEKYRAEVEAIQNAEGREQQDRAFRADPANAINYASQTTGVPLPQAQQIEDARQGRTRPPATPNDDEGNPNPAAAVGMPNVAPELLNAFRAALGSTQAPRFATGPTNANQMTQAGGNLLSQAITAAATNPDLSPAQRVANSEALTGKVVEPFKETASGAQTLNTMTGDTADTATDTGKLARAAVAALGDARTAQAGASNAMAARRGAAAVAEAAAGGGGTVAGASAAPEAGAGLAGDEFLKTLPPGIASNIKGIVAGTIPMTAFSIKGGHRERMLELAGQYEPGFDLTNWKRRNDTATAFAKGKQGDTLRNVDQTIAHMGSLEKASEDLNNMGGVGTLLNPVVNAVQEHTGDARQGVFRQKAQAVSSELRKVFAGSGGGSLTELEKWEQSLPLNASRDQQRAYLSSGVDLLYGAIGALDKQYKDGMGRGASVMDLISPKAKETLERLKAGASAPTERRSAPRDAGKRVVVDY